MKCLFCDANIAPGSQYCYNCGAEVGPGSSQEEVITAPEDLGHQEELLSGGGSLIGSAIPGGAAAIYESGNPPEDLERIKGWNWGAFVFTWIWAFAHRLWAIGAISLLLGFVNLGLFAAIFLGIMGNEYAWKARPFSSVEEFKETQKKWSMAALIFVFFIIGLILLAAALSALGQATR